MELNGDKIDYVDVNDKTSDDKSFEYKAKIAGETPKSPPQLENPGHPDRLAKSLVPSLNVAVNIPLLAVFGDLLIYLWLTVK